jgi:hypothetical protein
MAALTSHSLEQEILAAERELGSDERALRLWERMRIPPEQWRHQQYPETEPFWVIALLGRRCLYFNAIESGWGWGGYETHGEIREYHWQDDEIYHAVFQTLFVIDHGGRG